MKARAFLLACTAASLLPALAFADTPLETDAPPTLQAGPRIIHIPEPPRPAPRRRIEHPQKPQGEHPQKPDADHSQKRDVEHPPMPAEVAKPARPAEVAKPVAPQELLAPPEAAMPVPSQKPAEPRLRRPAQSKANRKIWI